MAVNWTEVLITLITVAGTVMSGYFARRSRNSMKQSSYHAQLAQRANMEIQNSIKPQPSLPHVDLGFEGDGEDTPTDGMLRRSLPRR